MRCILAISGLAIIYIDPTEPARFEALTYASLTAYCGWSLVLLLAANRGSARQSPWIDVAWATYLVALTQGTSSIFFFLFVFAILVGSFSGGYRTGVRLAIASSILFCVVGWTAAPEGDGFELNRSLIRPVYMLVMGWMMAVWGGREIVLRRRLALLRDVSGEWNPRLGVKRAIQANLERIVDFFSARECLLVVRRGGGNRGCAMYKASSTGAEVQHHVLDVDEPLAALLLDFNPAASLVHDGGGGGDEGQGDRGRERARQWANLLEAAVLAAVPYVQADGSTGRLFLIRDRGAFTDAEVAFLEQLAACVSRVVENTQLIDELVLKAAEHERFRISLDIHDSTVQPYIGLKLGLDALHREMQGNPLQHRVADLLEMANSTIRDLRGFATGIRELAPISGETLVNALREQAERFNRFYGVEVQLEGGKELFISPQIASEAFRMISEGLSNIMRHTSARRAFVRISRSENELRLVIANEPWGPPGNHSPFTPRSINARALSLGGTSFVEMGEHGRAAVHVTIPV